MQNTNQPAAGFPRGTLTAYGPTAERATKFVAAVLAGLDAAPIALKRWFVAKGDVRHDPRIAPTNFVARSAVGP